MKTKKAPHQSMPLAEATWVGADRLRYLNPEIVLFMKAAQTRPKDILDADLVLPLLAADRRAWLRETVAQVNRNHPWAELA